MSEFIPERMEVTAYANRFTLMYNGDYIHPYL